MAFIPAESITYESLLTPAQIRERIAASVEPRQVFRFRKNKNARPFEGNIIGDTFDINRIIYYRNSFRPQIKGQIEATETGSLIDVKLRLSVFVYIFLAFWCGSLGLFFMIFLTSSAMNGQFDPLVFIPLGMILFAYLMVTGGFKYEANIVKKDLGRILEATPTVVSG